jgi:hypothetical protein
VFAYLDVLESVVLHLAYLVVLLPVEERLLLEKRWEQGTVAQP